MKVKVSEAVVGDAVVVQTFDVAGEQSIVFLTPSVLNPALCARFYDKGGQVHQIEASRIVSIDPSDEVVDLHKRLEVLERERWTGPPRLGPKPQTREEVAAQVQKIADRLLIDAPPVDRSKQCTTSGEPVDKVRAEQTEKTGPHKSYIVLCEEERAKGFVRPYRNRYQHKTCGSVTTMGRALSETYARDPKFYGATFCVACNAHFPVAEFVWTADGEVVGS